ncbi:MAG: hypothetical protein ACRD3Q_07665 [Terriglobales bacterium]
MRHILFLSVLLLGATWAVAQNDQTSTSPNEKTSTTQNETTPTKAGGTTSVEGCLSGSSGNYTLTAKNGKMYELTGDTAKLSDHVGHEMKVTGTVENGSMTPSGGTAGESAGSKETLQVTSFKHISKTCSSGGGGMSH